MANTAAICKTFRKELLTGTHAFGTQGGNATRTVTTVDVFRFSLCNVSATFDSTTTAYTTTGEVTGTGYTATGIAVTNAAAPDNSGGTGIVAHWTPSATWTTGSGFTSSAAFDAALLYNDSSTSNAAVAVFTFGSQTVSSGTFSMTMPTSDYLTGLLRLS